MCILYVIYEKGNDCLLCDVCIESRLSKQTINSALRKLEGDGILYLKQDKGKNKRIHLTEKGREYTTYTAARLYEAERNALSDWTEEELSTYMRLMKKYNDCLRTQFDDIY